MEERRDFRHDWGFRDERIARVVRELNEKNEVKMGDAFVVRIPKIEGKTSLRKGEYADYVEYKVDGWYDPEKKQNRNRKVIIGQVIYPIPGSMLPNENYYKYFDRATGYEKTNTEGAEGMEQEAEETAKHAEVFANTREPSPCVSRKEMIRNVMEEDGIIRRSTERMREMIRGGYGNEMKDDAAGMDWGKTGLMREEGRESMREQEMENEMAGIKGEGNRESMGEQETETGEKMREGDQTNEAMMEGEEGDSEEKKKRRRRLRVLLDVLTSIRDVVKEQARKRPDEIMNEYQVEKINPVLEEIMMIEKEMGFGDLLEVIRKTEKGADGKVEVKGMSYGDIEVLLEYYNSVVWFTQSEMI